MAAKLPVFVVITSADCSACKNLRSSGDFNRDGPPVQKLSFFGYKWDAQFFWRLLTGESSPNEKSRAKFRVYELEYHHMNDTKFSGVKSFTEFVLTLQSDGVDVNRKYMYRQSESSDNYLVLDDASSSKTPVDGSGSFNDLITKTFPKGISSLIVQFPSFMWFGPNEWEKALLDNTYVPYGNLFQLKLGEKEVEGKKMWRVVERENDEKKKNPVVMAEYILANNGCLNPPATVKSEEKNSNNGKDNNTGNGSIRKDTNTGNSSSSSSTDINILRTGNTGCAVPLVRVAPLNNVGSYYSHR